MGTDNNRSEFARWIKQAKFDLSAARSSAKAGSNEWACFQAQQAGEKALKAFLYLHGKRDMLTHSVYELVSLASRLDKSANGLAEAKRLDHYYISTRYPGSIPADSPHEFFTSGDASECIRLAGMVIAWVERKGVL